MSRVLTAMRSGFAGVAERAVITRESDRNMRPIPDQLSELYRHHRDDLFSGYYGRAIQHLFWDAFCLQWVAVSWCVVVGREEP